MAALAACAALTACNAQSQQSGSLSSQGDKVSYIIGLQVGRNLRQQGVEFKPDLVLRGLRDASDTSIKPMLTDEEIQQVMTEFQTTMMNQQRTKDSAAAVTNASAGAQFLADNKSKPGVKTTASGLQYKVLKEGSGPRPKATSRVTVHYKGTLIDGTEFDSSERQGQPVTFPLNQVIPGWTEGLQLMNKGARYQFWVPSELAYGEQGQPPVIPPNSTLVFEVELLEIQ